MTACFHQLSGFESSMMVGLSAFIALLAVVGDVSSVMVFLR